VMTQSDAPPQCQDGTPKGVSSEPEAHSVANGQDAVAPIVVSAAQTDETSITMPETVNSPFESAPPLAGSIVPSQPLLPSQPLDGEAISDVSVTAVSQLGSPRSSASQSTVATDSSDSWGSNQPVNMAKFSANPPANTSPTDRYGDATAQNAPIVNVVSTIELQQAGQGAPTAPRTSRIPHPEAIKPSSSIGGNLQTTLRTTVTGAPAPSSTGQISEVPLPDMLALHLSQPANPSSDFPALAQAISEQKSSLSQAGQITDTANHAAVGTDNTASAANAVNAKDLHSGTLGNVSADPNSSPASGSNSHPVPDVPALQNPSLQPDSPQAPAAALAVPAMPGTTPGQADPSGPGTKADSGSPVPLPDSHSSPSPSEAGPSLSAGPVQMAQIVSKTAQSEMRIGLNTASFGSVEVRTIVQANDVGVVIGSEKGDLHALMTNELPGIANTLQQQNLRLNQVNFHQGFTFSGNSSSGGSDSQPRHFAAARTPLPAPADFSGDDSCAISMESMSDISTGLNVLA
jgi:hypothetical protein